MYLKLEIHTGKKKKKNVSQPKSLAFELFRETQRVLAKFCSLPFRNSLDESSKMPKDRKQNQRRKDWDVKLNMRHHGYEHFPFIRLR